MRQAVLAAAEYKGRKRTTTTLTTDQLLPALGVGGPESESPSGTASAGAASVPLVNGRGAAEVVTASADVYSGRPFKSRGSADDAQFLMICPL